VTISSYFGYDREGKKKSPAQAGIFLPADNKLCRQLAAI